MALKHTERMEFQRPTQRAMVFVTPDPVPQKEHPMPIIYIKKWLWEDLGKPHVINVTVEAMLPDDSEV